MAVRGCSPGWFSTAAITPRAEFPGEPGWLFVCRLDLLSALRFRFIGFNFNSIGVQLHSSWLIALPPDDERAAMAACWIASRTAAGVCCLLAVDDRIIIATTKSLAVQMPMTQLRFLDCILHDTKEDW
jgi:hypothetical protein